MSILSYRYPKYGFQQDKKIRRKMIPSDILMLMGVNLFYTDSAYFLMNFLLMNRSFIFAVKR